MSDVMKTLQEENRILVMEKTQAEQELHKTRVILWHVLMAMGSEVIVEEEQIDQYDPKKMFIGTDPVPNKQSIKYYAKYYG